MHQKNSANRTAPESRRSAPDAENPGAAPPTPQTDKATGLDSPSPERATSATRRRRRSTSELQHGAPGQEPEAPRPSPADAVPHEDSSAAPSSTHPDAGDTAEEPGAPHQPGEGAARRLSPQAAWTLLGTTGGLASRLRAASERLDRDRDIEAGWLRGAASLLERGERARAAIKARATWLEDLPREARARKAALLGAWVDAAEALLTAVHLHESERGPLVESLFPEWRGPSLRRHLDQALAAETELQRRLTSSYVLRRLGERVTETALRPALDALEAARRAWTAERDRPSLAGDEAEAVRTGLLDLAEDTSRALDRVRSIVRAALAARPDLVETVFPRRARPPEASDVPVPPVEEESAPPLAADEPPASAEASTAGPSPGGDAPNRARRRPRTRATTAAATETTGEKLAPEPARASEASGRARGETRPPEDLPPGGGAPPRGPRRSRRG